MFATGKLLNQLFQNFCELTEGIIYISEYKQILVRYHLHGDESKKRYFSFVLFRLNFGCKFGKMNVFDNILSHLSSIQAHII